jgi:hypothetical protein
MATVIHLTNKNGITKMDAVLNNTAGDGGSIAEYTIISFVACQCQSITNQEIKSS